LLLKVRQASRKLNKECNSVNRILGSNKLAFSYERIARNDFTPRHLERNAGSVDTAGSAASAENCARAPRLAITDQRIENNGHRRNKGPWLIAVEAVKDPFR
jgi:hypothetical protein